MTFPESEAWAPSCRASSGLSSSVSSSSGLLPRVTDGCCSPSSSCSWDAGSRAMECSGVGVVFFCFGILFFFFLHRPQGAYGCRMIVSLFIGEEKYKLKSCTQNSRVLLSRMFFLLVLGEIPFSILPKAFSKLFNFICLCDSVELVLNLEENKLMCIKHY